MGLTIRQPGLFSSLQDRGRFEGMPYGVPVSGAMDLHLYRFTNRVLNNTETCACIEFYQQGLQIEFTLPTQICVGALSAELYLNGSAMKVFQTIQVQNGDVLEVKHLEQGRWGYIAVKDGFISKTYFKSQSFYDPLTPKQFKKNDRVEYKSFKGETNAKLSDFNSEPYKTNILSVFEGPEFQKLSQTLQYQLKHAEFSLSTSLNRMAYHIQERLDNDLDELITGPVLPGTVQYTPQGKMIILMRDAQVTGGYPRILQLSEEAINQIAQQPIKSKFKFQLTAINS